MKHDCSLVTADDHGVLASGGKCAVLWEINGCSTVTANTCGRRQLLLFAIVQVEYVSATEALKMFVPYIPAARNTFTRRQFLSFSVTFGRLTTTIKCCC